MRRAVHLTADICIIICAAFAFWDADRYRAFLPIALILGAALSVSAARERLAGEESGRAGRGAGLFWLFAGIVLLFLGIFSAGSLFWG